MNRGRRDRMLATILFTDIVGSTEIAARVGDREWRRLVAAHHAAVRGQLRRFGGREVDTAGDGFFASFEQPAQAVRAADAILSQVSSLGLSLRAGIHTGETEMIGRKIGGIAVHIAARVVAAAAADQVFVSSTVRDLVSGSGLEFVDAGVHELKGVPGEWRLFALVREAHVDAAGDTTSEASAVARRQVDDPATRRISPVWVALGAIAILAMLGVVAYAAGLFGTAPAAPRLAPGPNTLVVINRSTGEISDVLETPAGPIAIQIDGAHAWIASLDAGIVSSRSVSGTDAGRTTGRVGRPTGLAIGNGTLWVADAFDKTLTLVDSTSTDIIDSVQNVMARDLVYGFESLWATDDISDRILRIDRSSGAIAQTLELTPGSFPRGIAAGLDAIWVTNAGTSTVSRVDPATVTAAFGPISLRYVPDAVAAGTDVWVTSRASDSLLRIDTQGNSVSATIQVGDQPTSIALDGQDVWVGVAGPKQVWHLTRDGTPVHQIDVGGVPTDIAIEGDHVYVTVSHP